MDASSICLWKAFLDLLPTYKRTAWGLLFQWHGTVYVYILACCSPSQCCYLVISLLVLSKYSVFSISVNYVSIVASKCNLKAHCQPSLMHCALQTQIPWNLSCSKLLIVVKGFISKIWYPFEQHRLSVRKNFHPFEQLWLSVRKRNVICLKDSGYLLDKNFHPFEWLGLCHPLKKNCHPLSKTVFISSISNYDINHYPWEKDSDF